MSDFPTVALEFLPRNLVQTCVFILHLIQIADSSKNMEDSIAVNTEKEYAAQLLGFVPSSFFDDLSEDSIDLVASSLEAMKQKMLKTFPDNCDKDDLDQAFKKVGVKYQENQEKVLEKLRSWSCAHIFKIPAHVLLPEDEAWDGETGQGVASKLLAVNSEMEVMRNKVKSALYKKAVLSSELENIENVCKSQERVIVKDKERLQNCNMEDCKDLMDFTVENKKVLAGRVKELELIAGDVSACDENKFDLDNNLTNKRRQEVNESNLDIFTKKLRKESVN